MNWSDLSMHLIVDPIRLPSLLAHLLLALLLGSGLAWHRRRFGAAPAAGRNFGALFPAIAASTLLIIAMVKGAIGLSLGVVGAMSVIRFRTPIKEPEDLAYLMLAMGVGVGLGAQQVVVTLVIYGAILLVFGTRVAAAPVLHRTRLEIDAPIAAPVGGGDSPAAVAMRSLLEPTERLCRGVGLRRVDVHPDRLCASLSVDLLSRDAAAELAARIRGGLTGATVRAFEERDGVPGAELGSAPSGEPPDRAGRG